ncbi:MAG: ketoacyl-ACP synthase III [Pseudobdellovibrionaceae bacterium]|nr:ketoacyl-ACP synthase III [Pseudobdellovibrionaceae bacterium]
MTDSAVYIHALGHYHPDTVVDNSFFEELDIGSESSWVVERTGIEARRSVLQLDDIRALRRGEKTLNQLRDEGRVMSIATMSEPAWALLRSRYPELKPAAIDALICGTSIPDFDIPANASTIANRLGLSCLTFDANSACSSFVLNLHLARSLILSGAHNKIAVFNPERYSLRMDFTDRNSCILFGDGCSAAIISGVAKPGALKLIDTIIVSDPSGYDLVKIPDGECFSQNGKAVQKFAISKTLETTHSLLERNRLTPKDITYFTGHQANLRMVTSAAERLGFSEDKHLHNVAGLGNQGAAGAPSVLSMHWDRFKPGDLMVLAVVGSGLTWGSALLQKI